jgi:hypothetical protein
MDRVAFIAELMAMPEIPASRRCVVCEAAGWVTDLAECMRTRKARAICARRSEAWRKLLYDPGSAAGYCDPRETVTLIARIAGYFDVPELMRLNIARDRADHINIEYGVCACASDRTIAPELEGEPIAIPADMMLRAVAFAGVSRNDTGQFEYDIPRCVEEYLRTPGTRRDAFIQSIVAADGDVITVASQICASRALFDALPEHARRARSLIMLRIARIARDWDHPLVAEVRNLAHVNRLLDKVFMENLLYNEDFEFSRRMIIAMDIAHIRPVSMHGILMLGVSHVLAVLRMCRDLGYPYTNVELRAIVQDYKMGGVFPVCDEDLAGILMSYD